MVRCRVRITGAVQGVGFRPFVYRLAKRLGLSGWVKNCLFGVEVEVEGEREAVESFLRLVVEEAPEVASICALDYRFLPPAGLSGFEIRRSEEYGRSRVFVLPDIATCDMCLSEVFDPGNRRFRYPFTNCTHCGPRFTIIERLPYDRENTTMRRFRMCRLCEREYNDPSDRRFHAQPNACWECGPTLSLVEGGVEVARGDRALVAAAERIRAGGIVAVKGLGGFHLMCLAEDGDVVDRLRRRKRRYEKPFAVMFSSVDEVGRFCLVGDSERRVLSGVERPIVLLKSRGGLPFQVSCGFSTVGAFLPYTPLHHLLLSEVKRPVVATSANVSDEPMVKDNREALDELSGIADAFLLHNRDIARRCDDSVCFVAGPLRVMVRRARGFAPVPVQVGRRFPRCVLALGGHLKATVALALDENIFVSQHIGDLDTPKARGFFEETVRDFLRLFQAEPEVVVVDKHPGYYSRRYGLGLGLCAVELQHHVAHALSAAAEVGWDGPFAAVCLDGTGYGDDATVWGGEVLVVSPDGYERAFCIRPYAVAGGERAVREGYRCAVSLCLAAGVDPPGSFVKRVGEERLRFAASSVKAGINTFVTSSAGRLFDAASSLAGVRDVSSFEAQAAVLFEHAGWDVEDGVAYPFRVEDGFVDWRGAVLRLVEDVERGVDAGVISRRFHNGFVRALFECVLKIREARGINRVALSGGVFQNRLVLEGLYNMLRGSGFEVFVNQMVPVNDGGISLGQAFSVLFFKKGVLSCV